MKPRTDWPRLWSALPAREIAAVADDYERDFDVTDLSLPQSGLSLVKLRDAALLDTWYLGEIPLARAHVRVRAPGGLEAEGGVQLLDDRARLARRLAVLDAVLSGRLPGWERAAALLEQGEVERAKEETERRAIITATEVDFDMLNAPEDEDD